jgi:hypothetical protein
MENSFKEAVSRLISHQIPKRLLKPKFISFQTQCTILNLTHAVQTIEQD